MSLSPASDIMDLQYQESSQSANSDSSQLSYTNDVESLPANGPITHAHIIDISQNLACLEQNGDGTAKLQDAVVTTLFHHSPATLRAFLCPTVNTFKAIFGNKKDTQLVIWRKGLEVFLGTFEHHTSLKAYRFELLAGFLIGYDGAWRLKATASNAYAHAKWGDVWAGKFFANGGVAKMTVEVGEGEGEGAGMAATAARLAGVILRGRYWARDGRVG